MTLLLLVAATECDDREGDLGAAVCWTAEAGIADRELNAIWPRITEKARASDKSFKPSPKKQRASAITDLLASQRAWLQLRRTQCSLEGDYAQGGSLKPVIAGRCYTNMTRQRTKQLADIAEGFDES